jgi:hypothetical protein
MDQISKLKDTSNFQENAKIQTITELEQKCRQLQQELHVQQNSAEMLFPIPMPWCTLDEH